MKEDGVGDQAKKKKKEKRRTAANSFGNKSN